MVWEVNVNAAMLRGAIEYLMLTKKYQQDCNGGNVRIDDMLYVIQKFWKQQNSNLMM